MYPQYSYYLRMRPLRAHVAAQAAKSPVAALHHNTGWVSWLVLQVSPLPPATAQATTEQASARTHHLEATYLTSLYRAAGESRAMRVAPHLGITLDCFPRLPWGDRGCGC